MNLAYPFRIDGRGRSAISPEEEWIRGLIEQLLFTLPGERVMRPDFGSGILQLVFAPNSPELAAATQMVVQGALQQALSGLIVVEGLSVEAIDSTLRITIQYVIRRSQSRVTQTFRAGGGGS
jgi:phage baseplate assembly protein W